VIPTYQNNQAAIVLEYLPAEGAAASESEMAVTGDAATRSVERDDNLLRG
jgi:hypothetical protein